jgi:hypothetical protein
MGMKPTKEAEEDARKMREIKWPPGYKVEIGYTKSGQSACIKVSKEPDIGFWRYGLKSAIKSAAVEKSRWERGSEEREWVKKFGSKELKRRVRLGFPGAEHYLKERIMLELGEGWAVIYESPYSSVSDPSDAALVIYEEVVRKGLQPEIRRGQSGFEVVCVDFHGKCIAKRVPGAK